jgi:hypothetical protein
MFYKLAFIALSFVSIMATAKELTPQEIRDRFELHADVYLMDSSGKKIVDGPLRTNYWRVHPETGTIKGDWSSDFGRSNETPKSTGVAFRQNWEITSDGTIKATIEEFGNISDDRSNPVLTNLLERKDVVLEKFEPIVWKVKNPKSPNVVVRFIPSLKDISQPIALDSLPVAGTGISISDNAGYLWAEGVQFNGKYSGVTSHRGTLALSYVPFAGAKEMGFAKDNLITLNFDKKYQINLKGETSFLPAGVIAKVYAVYLPEKKSKGFNSLHTFDTGSKSRIEEVLKK